MTLLDECKSEIFFFPCPTLDFFFDVISRTMVTQVEIISLFLWRLPHWPLLIVRTWCDVICLDLSDNEDEQTNFSFMENNFLFFPSVRLTNIITKSTKLVFLFPSVFFLSFSPAKGRWKEGIVSCLFFFLWREEEEGWKCWVVGWLLKKYSRTRSTKRYYSIWFFLWRKFLLFEWRGWQPFSPICLCVSIDYKEKKKIGRSDRNKMKLEQGYNTLVREGSNRVSSFVLFITESLDSLRCLVWIYIYILSSCKMR